MVCVCLVLLFSPPSNLFVGFFKNLLFRKWRRLKIHQKNNSFSSAQCARHFSIEMKRELKMNTWNTCSSMYLCVHFQRYLFANVRRYRHKTRAFFAKKRGCFLLLFVPTSVQKKGRRIFETTPQTKEHHNRTLFYQTRKYRSTRAIYKRETQI